MPFSVIKAMRESPTPDHFARKLLNAVKNQEWLEPLPSPAEAAALEGRESLPHVTFVSDRDAAMGFAIERTHLRNPDAIRRNGYASKQPAIHLFDSLQIPLERESWDAALAKLGSVSIEHPADDGFGSESQKLLLPFDAVAHWKPFMALKTLAGKRPAPSYAVPVSHEALMELMKYGHAERTMRAYLAAIQAVSRPESMSPSKLARHLHLPRQPGETREGVLKRFANFYGENAGFFNDAYREIAATQPDRTTYSKKGGRPKQPAKSQGAIKTKLNRLVAEHFRLPESAFTRKLSREIAASLRGRETLEAARKIALLSVAPRKRV